MKITVTQAQSGLRLDKFLVQNLPGLGRAAAKRLFEKGRVRVFTEGSERGRKASKGDVVAAGEIIDIELSAEELSASALPDPDAPLKVVLERPDLLVLEKPAGQPSAPLSAGERGTLANALLARYPEVEEIGFSPREPGLCHRLDTDTSGLLLAARTQQAFEVLSTALKEGRLDKRYRLVCEARDLPEEGSIEIPLAPHPKDRRRVYPCIHPRDVARYAPRPAHTSYKVLRVHGDLALVEVKAPKALRHQIRAHFAAIEHPLVGDLLYGGRAVEGLTRHALHACSIVWGGDSAVPAFHVVSPLPADICALVGEEPEAEVKAETKS